MDSIREQITQALFVRLETLLTTNGYNVDVGANANRAKKNYDEEELPALSLWVLNEVTTNKYSSHQKKMIVDIESFKLIKDEVLPDDAIANQMIADIQKCVGTYDAPLMELIEGLKETNTEPIYPDDGSDIISVRVTYEITYMMVKGDPYLQP